jgi:hypothetical protein
MNILNKIPKRNLIYLVGISIFLITILGLIINNQLKSGTIQSVLSGKTDQQKWEEFKPILKKDAEAFNNWIVKDYQVAEKHYPIVKNINCEKLQDFTNKENCKNYKELTIKKVEKPTEIKYIEALRFDEYQLLISSATSF